MSIQLMWILSFVQSLVIIFLSMSICFGGIFYLAISWLSRLVSEPFSR